jgi:hypothetical protein
MKHLSITALFTAFAALGTLSFAQVPGQQAPGQQRRPPSQQADPADPSATEGAPLTLTGCLMKGTSASEYMITDSKSGEKYTFGAPDQLQRYLNQTVQLTGTVTTQGADKAFRPSSVKSISPSCERAQ